MHATTRTWIAALGFILLLPVAGAADGQGLVADPYWARWQGRLWLGTSAPAWRGEPEADSGGLKFGNASLLGDYYFARSGLGAGLVGGFRATSGLIVGSRSLPWSGTASSLDPGAAFSVERRSVGLSGGPRPGAEADTAAVPYVGIGYSGLSLKGGWRFSADLGLTAGSPGSAVKFGRVFSGTQSLDDLLRELRLAPLLQLGVSYAF